MTLISLLLAQADQHPNRVAIIDKNGYSITFAGLAKQSSLMACALQQKNIRRDDKVLVAVWPGIDLYITLAALWRLGAIAVFPEASMGFKGLRHAAAKTTPKAMIAAPSIRFLHPFISDLKQIDNIFPPTVRGNQEFDGNDALETDGALISFTSGTTGEPKAMMRSHALLLAQHEALSDLMGSTQIETDLIAFPAFALSSLGHGHTFVLPNWNMKRHDKVSIPLLSDYIKRKKITRLIVPPVVIEKMVNSRTNSILSRMSSIRTIITGGGPLYPDIMARFKTGFPGIRLAILYGSTEAEPISHIYADNIKNEDVQKTFIGCGLPVGKPNRYSKILLSEQGEIMVAGKHVNESYIDESRNKETKFKIHGKIYHRTGDIGRFDLNGMLWLLGRLGTQCNNLYPFSLEIEARRQPGIKEAAAMTLNGRMIMVIRGKLPSDSSPFMQEMIHKGVIIYVVHYIPRDNRHRSKINYNYLKKIINKKKSYKNNFTS